VAQNIRQMQPLLVKPARWIYWLPSLQGCLTTEVGDGVSLRSSSTRVSRVVNTASIVMRIIVSLLLNRWIISIRATCWSSLYTCGC
jgi:hypothetical protein